MAKRNSERSRLLDLVASATKLQEVVKGLRPHKAESEELEAAEGSVRLALDAIVIEILQNHCYEVELRLDPQRPQRWEDYLAVLEIIHDESVVKIPVPKLRHHEELAEYVRRRVSVSTKKGTIGKIAASNAEEVLQDAAKYLGDVKLTEEDFAYFRTVASQRASRAAQPQRTGWKHEDYRALKRAVFTAVRAQYPFQEEFAVEVDSFSEVRPSALIKLATQAVRLFPPQWLEGRVEWFRQDAKRCGIYAVSPYYEGRTVLADHNGKLTIFLLDEEDEPMNQLEI